MRMKSEIDLLSFPSNPEIKPIKGLEMGTKHLEIQRCLDSRSTFRPSLKYKQNYMVLLVIDYDGMYIYL